MTVQIFRSREELRRWLEKNHDCVPELWLGLYNKRSEKKSITYREAVDEALCFGWIDGVRKSVNPTTYKQRFTPRKTKSYWSAVNIRRFAELKDWGRSQLLASRLSSNAKRIPASIRSNRDRRYCRPPIPHNSNPT
jgi:uncharacterized protein YdeI (YjbR/CyaY-like superfamily)